MDSVDVAEVKFIDQIQRLRGIMKIFSLKEKSLFVLSPGEAAEYNEELVQLIEGCTYEYQLVGTEKDATVGDGVFVIPSRSQNGITGTIMTRHRAGLLPLYLKNQEGKTVASASVEVQSAKINYRSDYRNMLDFIGDRCNDLLLDIHSQFHVRLNIDPGMDTSTIQQRYAILNTILNSQEFRESLNRVVSMPYGVLMEERRFQNIRQRFTPTYQSLKQLAQSAKRTQLPESHTLYSRLRSVGVQEPSVPENIVVSIRRENIDNAENRFVKHCLVTFVDYLTKIESVLSLRMSRTVKRLLTDVSNNREYLNSILSKDFFREVGIIQHLPLNSPVLQRKSGYREVFQAWLKFNLAARLLWQGGDDVFGAGKKDLPRLYEYWIFFQMLDIMRAKFHLYAPPVSELIHVSDDGISLRLKSGKELAIEGSFTEGTIQYAVRLSYNKTFLSNRSKESEGSWTRQLRPDYTISFWPARLTAIEAESQGNIIHLHFDAKYRVQSLNHIFGPEDSELDNDETLETSETYKRDDLFKMHAYKDAIRRTQGAYILYPGTENKLWSANNDVLPSIGAFAIKPGRAGTVTNVSEIHEFLDSVIKYLSKNPL